MSPWTLRLFGDCELIAPDGRPVHLSTRKSLAMLAYLALQPGRRAKRQRLALLLWEEAGAEQGRLHVRKALWLLKSESARAAPDAPPPVMGEADALTIPSGLLVTDADAFLEAAAEAGDDEAALERAAARYPADLLSDFSVRNAPAFDDWAESERQRLREVAVSLLHRLAEAASAAGNIEGAMRAALRLIALDPLGERAHRALMRLHVRQGRHAAALAQYHQLRETLRRELGVDPEPETQALFREIAAGRRAAEARPAPAAAQEPEPDPRPPSAPDRVEPAALVRAPRSRPRRGPMAAALSAAALVALGGWTYWAQPLAPRPPQVEHVFPVAVGLVVTGRPALSPDGSRIAFTARQADSDNIDLYLFTIGDAEPVRLTTDGAMDDNATWSADGTAIAFSRAVPDASVPCRIFVMTVPGGAEHPAGACRTAGWTRLAFMPDGRSLLFTDRADPDAPSAIFRLFLADGRIVPLTDPPPDLIGDREPVLSADGRTLAFLRATSWRAADIHLLDIESGAIERVTENSGAVGGLAWSRDDAGLLFSSDRGGDAGLWWVRRRGGAPERVSEGLLRYRGLSHARGRARLLFEGLRDRSSLHALPDGVRPDAFLAGLAAQEGAFRDWFPDVAADGTRLFVSTRSGTEQIWTCRGDEPPRQLTQFQGWRIVQPRWSPDGRHIAFIGIRGGEADLYVLPRGGGQPRRLTRDRAEDSAPAWSPDGRHLYFASRRGGRPAVWRIDAFASGAEAARVTPDGPGDLRVDPDGRWIYYVHPGRSGIWRRVLSPDGGAANGREERIVDGLAAGDGMNWAVTRDSIFYVRRPAGVTRGARLVRLDLASGATEDVADASGLHRISGFAVAPDGRLVFNLQTMRVELYGMDFD